MALKNQENEKIPWKHAQMNATTKDNPNLWGIYFETSITIADNINVSKTGATITVEIKSYPFHRGTFGRANVSKWDRIKYFIGAMIPTWGIIAIQYDTKQNLAKNTCLQ